MTRTGRSENHRIVRDQADKRQDRELSETKNRDVAAAIAGAWGGFIFLAMNYFEYRGFVQPGQIDFLAFALVLLMGVPFIAVLFGPEFVRVFKHGMPSEKEMQQFMSDSGLRFFCFFAGTLVVYAPGRMILQMVLN